MPSLEALLSHCISLPHSLFAPREMNKIQKVTKFFLPTSKEVHDAAVAADSSKHKLTLLQQMRHSTAKHNAIALAKKEETARLTALRKAEEELQESAGSMEMEVRAEIDAVAEDSPIDLRPTKAKRPWCPRGKNWLLVAEHFDVYGFESTLRTFPEEFIDCTRHAAYQRMVRWKILL